jgi:hypothetical protein
MARSTVPRRILSSLGAHERFSVLLQSLLALGLFVFALTVRSLHAVDLAPVLESRSQPGVRMATRYDAAADAILRGDGVFFPTVVDPRDTALLARPPGYPLLLAAVYSTLGRSFYAVGVFQNLVDSAVAVLLFWIGTRLVSLRVGFVAGCLFALGHYSAYYANLITPDTLCVFPILLALALLVRTRPKRLRSIVPYLAAGALLGFSCWLRPNTLVLGPFIALLFPILYGWERATLVRGGALALACGLAISPITLRNYRIYGKFVPISVNLGIVLWEGIADGGGERFGAKGRDFEVAWQESQEHHDARYAEWWASPDGISRDRERIHKSLAVIRANPLWFAHTIGSRVVTMLTYAYDDPPLLEPTPPEPFDLVRRLTPGEIACLAWGTSLRGARPSVVFAQKLLKACLVPSLAVGVAALLLASPKRALLLGLVPLSVLVFQSPMHLEFRVTLPMHALLLVFAGAGLVLAFSLLAQGARRLGNAALKSGG